MVSTLFTNELAYLGDQVKLIAGVDEAGRGACAGPLVVAACILGNDFREELQEVRDSKLLSAVKRKKLFTEIRKLALDYSIVEISSQKIDEIGVHKANLLGFQEAVLNLSIKPDLTIIDGFSVKNFPTPTISLVKADTKIASVAAASILAKVYRDQLMEQYDGIFSGYNFKQHKGYVTALHTEKLQHLGPSPIHRFSYKNVGKLIS